MSPTDKNPQRHGAPWWQPDQHADRRPMLLARNRIKSAFRQWFGDQGYIEVETSALQLSPGNEVHLHAFKTELVDEMGAGAPVYLHTSPEFACKKLLAAGEEKIFTFAPVFRNRERGALHHPAFTMLEWYEAGADYTRLMDHCSELLRIAAETTERPNWSFGGHDADALAPPLRIAVADAFQQHATIDLLETVEHGTVDRDGLARQAVAAGIRIADDDTWSDIFTRILVERVEPAICTDRPCILDAYPIPEAALARPSPADPRVAERFELYCCGVELANAFGELTDPVAQRARFEADMDAKQRLYGERYPVDEDFIAALTLMPPASGCALGFDRLVMLATGAQRVDQVVWTPTAEFSP
ncbi:MAG: EF-P lysine aminoacylase EpmA [Hyphomicrobiaceae bacterium]